MAWKGWTIGKSRLAAGLARRGLRFLSAACVLSAWACSPVPAAEEPEPCTYLFDTGKPSPGPWAAPDIRARTGWTPLAEDDTTHRFQGDAVLLNDRLAIVLRQAGTHAECYGRSPGATVYHAAIGPRSDVPAGALGRDGLKIVENGPAAVMIEATFASGGASRQTLGYRLTAGQATVELRGGAGAAAVGVGCGGRFAIVPDYFGDDMVFDAQSPFVAPRPRPGATELRLPLPAENYLLAPLGTGEALLVCLWPSAGQGAEAVVQQSGSQRSLWGYSIRCSAGQTVWVALLEGESLWHYQPIAPEKAAAEVPLDWQPPLPAKWRCDLTTPKFLAASVYLADQQSRVPIPDGMHAPTGLLVYAIDRTRTTPLTSFCPIDILRSTLGMGPCQYILQTEGLAADSDPTPDHVMGCVEKQFAKNRSRKSAGEIREMLQQMVEHFAHAQARIERYAAFARKMQDLLDAGKGASGRPGDELLSDTAAYLRQSLAAAAPSRSDRAAELAAQVAVLIDQENATAEVQKIGETLRSLGAVQDSTLARCRMAARWLKSLAAMLADDPQGAELAHSIRAAAEDVLKTK